MLVELTSVRRVQCLVRRKPDEQNHESRESGDGRNPHRYTDEYAGDDRHNQSRGAVGSVVVVAPRSMPEQVERATAAQRDRSDNSERFADVCESLFQTEGNEDDTADYREMEHTV